MTALILLELVIVGWLPGAAIFRLPLLDRDRRAGSRGGARVLGRRPQRRHVARARARAGRAPSLSFKRLLIADALLALALAVAARGACVSPPGSAARRRRALIPLALRPARPRGGSLRRRNTSSAARIPASTSTRASRSRSAAHSCYRDPVVAAVPPFARDLFFPHDRRARRLRRAAVHGVLHPRPGYRRRGRPVPAPLPRLDCDRLRARRADRRAAGGRRLGRSSASCGVLRRRAPARAAGGGAAAALCWRCNVVQVWFSRYPNAEVVMQALLFAALLANARAHVDGDPFFAPVAGALLGLLLFLRFDAVVRSSASLAALALGDRRGPARALDVRRRRSPPRPRCARGTCSGRCANTAHLPIVFLRTCRPGSTPALGLMAVTALAADRRRPAIAGDLERGASMYAPMALTVVVCRRWRSMPVLPASRRQADRLRRLRAADLHVVLPHAPGASSRR